MVLDALKALADPVRLRLMRILEQGEFTVQELTTILDMGQSRISRHLKILLDAGLAEVKRQGTWAYYRHNSHNSLYQAIRSELEGVGREDLPQIAALMQQRRDASRTFFDRHARQWDALARTILPLPDYYAHIASLLGASSTILEVGTGTGVILDRLAGEGRRVIGVDNSPAMLDEAKKRVADAGLQGIELRLGDMEHLPLKDGEADTALLNMVLHHAPRPAAVLGETIRTLTKGGRLIIADLLQHGEERARNELADLWLGFSREELQGWLLAIGYQLTRWDVIGAQSPYPVFIALGEPRA